MFESMIATDQSAALHNTENLPSGYGHITVNRLVRIS